MTAAEREVAWSMVSWVAVACSAAQGVIQQDAATLRSEAAVLESIGMERGVDRLDLERASAKYSVAIELVEDPSEQDAIRGEIRSIEERLVHRVDGIAGYSPIMPAILGVPQLFEHLDDASETALESGVLLFLEAAKLGLIRSDQYHLAILSQEAEESQEALVQMLLYRETTQELLNAGSLASLISPSQVEELRRSPHPIEGLRSLASALESRGLGRVRVGVLQIAPPRRSGEIVARDLTGRFLSADGQSVVSRTETGFAQFVGSTPWLIAALMLMAMLPLQQLLTSIVRRADSQLAAATPPPWWLGVGCGLAAYVLAMLAGAGIGAIGIDPETLSASPRGIALVAGTSAAFMLLPASMLILGLTRVPAFASRVGNADLMTTIVVGACYGSFVRLCELASARMGVSAAWPSILAGAVPCIAVAAALGFAFAKSLRGDRAWIASAGVAAVAAVAVMAGALRFELAAAPIAAALGIGLALAVPLVAHRVARRDEGTRSTEGLVPHDGDSLGDRLGCPPYALAPTLASHRDDAIAWIDGDLVVEGPRILLVTGRAGVGKTRFLAELVKVAKTVHAARESVFEAFVGHCDDPSLRVGPTPFEPFQQAMGQLLGVSAMAGPADAMRRLRNSVAAKGLQAALGTVGMGSLAGLLDAGGDESSAKTAGRAELARSVATVLEHRAGCGGVVLAIDDAQWIDEESEQVLQAMLGRIRSSEAAKRISIVLLARSGDEVLDRLRAAAPIGLPVRRIELDSVIDADGEELRRRVLEGLGLDAASRRRIEAELDRRMIEAPGAVLSFISMLASRDALVEHGRTVSLKETEDLAAVPPIEDPAQLLSAMTIDMSGSAIEVLRCASIIGTRFRASILAEIFNLDVLDLIRDLNQAEARGLVRDVLDVDDCYEFADRRIASAFRAEAGRAIAAGGDRRGIPQVVREYHRRYVRVGGAELEARWGDLRDAPYSEIASIAEHAMQLRDSDPGVAVQWAKIVAERSLARGLAGAARRAIAPAFEIVRQRKVPGLSPRSRLELAECVVRAMVEEGGEGELLDRAIEEGDRVFGQGIEALDSARRVSWDLLAAEGLYRNRRFDEVISRVTSVEKSPAVGRAERLRAAFLAAASISPADFASRNQALEAVCREIDLERPGASEDEAARVLRIEAEVLNTLGFGLLRDPADDARHRAMACFEAALEINRGGIAPDRRGERISLGGLGDVLQRLERVAEAEDCYTKNLEASREDGDLAGVTRMTSMLAGISLSRVERGDAADREGELSRAEALLAESLESADRQRNADGAAFALAGMLRAAVLGRRETGPTLARIEDRRELLKGCREFSRMELDRARSLASDSKS